MEPTDALPTAPEPVEPAADPTPDEDGRVDFRRAPAVPVTIRLVDKGRVPFAPRGGGEDGTLDENPGPLVIPPNSSRTITVNFIKGGFVNFQPSEEEADVADEDSGPLDIPPNSSRTFTVRVVKGGFVNFQPSEDYD
ncbi:MAG: hypothetical protein K2X82_25960 [Gemmataceae bacterium]|nr:hypothetical protein [Gemmataceae bacterium]